MKRVRLRFQTDRNQAVCLESWEKIKHEILLLVASLHNSRGKGQLAYCTKGE